jgi:hypothetical protein
MAVASCLGMFFVSSDDIGRLFEVIIDDAVSAPAYSL